MIERCPYADQESGVPSSGTRQAGPHPHNFQMIGVEEDRLAKPNRPIVSGRISLEAAQRLYFAVGTIAVLYSIYQRLLLCSTIYMVAIYCYNEGNMARNWFLKSLLGAIGYVCYCWGTTIIFGNSFLLRFSVYTNLTRLDHGEPLSRTSIIAVAVSGLVHVTTVCTHHIYTPDQS
jgi:4-hydroxybenzoate polyprenyltransferase